jgi:hypothetical protein
MEELTRNENTLKTDVEKVLIRYNLLTLVMELTALITVEGTLRRNDGIDASEVR